VKASSLSCHTQTTVLPVQLSSISSASGVVQLLVGTFRARSALISVSFPRLVVDHIHATAIGFDCAAAHGLRHSGGLAKQLLVKRPAASSPTVVRPAIACRVRDPTYPSPGANHGSEKWLSKTNIESWGMSEATNESPTPPPPPTPHHPHPPPQPSVCEVRRPPDGEKASEPSMGVD